MLQVVNDSIVETQNQLSTTGGAVQDFFNSNWNYYSPYQYQPVQYWYGYTVYIYTDKTKKAIEILKTLQSEKLLECKSVNKFIELVEKISSLL